MKNPEQSTPPRRIHVDPSLDWMRDNWREIVVRGTTQASSLLGMNPNTMRTRLARDQALAVRRTSGERSTPEFAPYHLIVNLISDRLLRYGISQVTAFGTDAVEATSSAKSSALVSWSVFSAAEWIENTILKKRKHEGAVIRAMSHETGMTTVKLYVDGDVEPLTGDAALIIPIGSMVVRLACTLYAKVQADNNFAFYKSSR